MCNEQQEEALEMSKSPRLHHGCTLSDAARWLSVETTEEWTVQAVLSRLVHDWSLQGGVEHRLLPCSLDVAISPGTELVNRMTGETETTQRWRMMCVGRGAIGAMLEGLLQFGEATDVALIEASGARWLCRSPLRSDCLRLSPNVIDSLVPEFDRLVQSIYASGLECEWDVFATARHPQDFGPDNLTLGTESATGASPPNDGHTLGDPTEQSWIMQARKRAEQIVKRQQARDLYPSQLDIADEIAREFRTSGVTGVSGKPLSGEYIKRHALRGMSSQQAQLKSSTVRRGK